MQGGLRNIMIYRAAEMMQRDVQASKHDTLVFVSRPRQGRCLESLLWLSAGLPRSRRLHLPSGERQRLSVSPASAALCQGRVRI